MSVYSSSLAKFDADAGAQLMAEIIPNGHRRTKNVPVTSVETILPEQPVTGVEFEVQFLNLFEQMDQMLSRRQFF